MLSHTYEMFHGLEQGLRFQNHSKRHRQGILGHGWFTLQCEPSLRANLTAGCVLERKSSVSPFYNCSLHQPKPMMEAPYSMTPRRSDLLRGYVNDPRDPEMTEKRLTWFFYNAHLPLVPCAPRGLSGLHRGADLAPILKQCLPLAFSQEKRSLLSLRVGKGLVHLRI
jgi:hypothetical protein